MKKKRAAKRFCVKKAATRILKRVAAMKKLPKAEDFTLRGVEGRLCRGPRMTVMVVDPDSDIEKRAGMVVDPDADIDF